MALFDALFNFSGGTTSGGQLITSTDDSEDVLDMQAADLEMGAGEPIYLNIRVGTAFAGQGSTTIVFALVHDADATLTSGATVVWQSPAIDESILVAGYWVKRMALPVNFDEEQYVGLLYTVASGPMTGGSIHAWLDHGPQSSYDTQVAASNI